MIWEWEPHQQALIRKEWFLELPNLRSPRNNQDLRNSTVEDSIHLLTAVLCCIPKLPNEGIFGVLLGPWPSDPRIQRI